MTTELMAVTDADETTPPSGDLTPLDLIPLPLLAGEHPPVAGAVKVKVLNDGSGHHHSARLKARKAALDILYSADVTGRDALDILDAEPPLRDLTGQIVEGVYYHQLAIDDRISQAAPADWTPERMPAIDRAIARIAVWEIVQGDVEPAVAISQALELADEYSTDKSSAFLNGLLGRVAAALPALPDSPPDETVAWRLGGADSLLTSDSEPDTEPDQETFNG